MVGNHVAGTGIEVVAVAAVQHLPHLPPVGLGGADVAHVVHQAAELVGLHIGHAAVEELVQILLVKGRRLQGAQEACRVQGHAVVGHAGAGAHQPVGLLGVAGAHHGIGIHEDLGADLLGKHRAVAPDGPALRGGDAPLQVQVGGMLGGVAHAAPPEDGPVFDDVVEPGLADLLRRHLRGEAVVLHGTEEGEGARQVVVSHDEGKVQLIVDIIGNLAEPVDDGLVGPALHRVAQIHADHLTQNTGVDLVAIGLG